MNLRDGLNNVPQVGMKAFAPCKNVRDGLNNVPQVGMKNFGSLHEPAGRFKSRSCSAHLKHTLINSIMGKGFSAMIPDDFQFSQSNLQDFVDCRRRFQLRYIQRLAWPAIEIEPVQEHERELQRGSQFHHIIHQHLLGVPEPRLTAMVHDEELLRWWQAYLAHSNEFSPEKSVLYERRYPEATLSAPLNGFRLMAKYDLLLISDNGQARIWDWKTSRQPPGVLRRRVLEARLQTRIYPYLLSQAGAQFNNGQPILPDQIEMVYWFANSPEQPEHFPYCIAQHHEDEHYLIGLIEQIKRLDGEYPKTTDEQRCRFCVYRSLCERGIQAGSMDAGQELDFADNLGIDWDFENIDAIAF